MQMRYVPDLIPERNRVLPDYFTTARSGQQAVTVHSLPSNIGGVILLLFALGNIQHPLLTLLLGFAGALIFPLSRKWIERKFVFKLTVMIRTVSVVVLFLIAFPLNLYYTAQEEQARIEAERREKQFQAEQLLIAEKKKAKRDTLTRILNESVALIDKNRFDKALEQLDLATRYGQDAEDLSSIAQLRIRITEKRAISGKENSEMLYYRGLCYARLGNMAEAVNDLKRAIARGNSKANKLHDQINPIRQRVIYYVTRCCDGSTSSAKGRGACSHHGGVCNWNDPVYEQYRKYLTVTAGQPVSGAKSYNLYYVKYNPRASCLICGR